FSKFFLCIYRDMVTYSIFYHNLFFNVIKIDYILFFTHFSATNIWFGPFEVDSVDHMYIPICIITILSKLKSGSTYFHTTVHQMLLSQYSTILNNMIEKGFMQQYEELNKQESLHFSNNGVP
ncbi:hypothetical protein ACJX0J_020687, partial [Zea mays]